MTQDELISTELGDIIVRLTSFQATFTREKPLCPDEAVSTLLQIDSDLERWAFTLPPSWSYETFSCVPRDSFYTNFHYRYPGFSVAVAWNQYRTARCLANDLLLAHLEAPCSGSMVCDLTQHNQAQETIQKHCIDICASAPYFLRQIDQTDPSKPGVGAFEVMWALDTCARMNCNPATRRLWAIEQLEDIGRDMGIHQALQLAHSVKSKFKYISKRGRKALAIKREEQAVRYVLTR